MHVIKEGDGLKILHSRNELEGTCYIELLPGKYCGTCWNEGSLFFTEEDFGYFFSCTKTEYMENFDESNKRLIAFISELSKWINEKCDSYMFISVLGI